MSGDFIVATSRATSGHGPQGRGYITFGGRRLPLHECVSAFDANAAKSSASSAAAEDSAKQAARDLPAELTAGGAHRALRH